MKQPQFSKAPIIAAGGALYLAAAPLGLAFSLLIFFILMGLEAWHIIRIYREFRSRPSHLSVDFSLLLASGFLLLMISQSALKIAEYRTNIGLPSNKVQAMKVLVLSDPIPRDLGYWVSEGSIIEAYGDGLSVISRGRVGLSSSLPSSGIAAGREIRIDGKLVGDGLEGWSFRIESLHPGPYRNRLFLWRAVLLEKALKKLEQCSRDTYTFLSALILGRQVDPGSPVILAFRESGCLHLLALSGFHVGIIAAAFSSLLKPVIGVKFSVLSTFFVVLFYLVLVGIRPSLLRAVIMYGLWSIDKLRGTLSRPLSYLGMAFIFQALLFPASVATLSFRLSYAALAGIIIGGRYLFEVIRRFLPVFLAGPIGIGLGAQAATLPIVVAAFGIWRPVAILAAPVLTPFVVLSMIAGSVLILMPDVRIVLILVFFLDSIVRLMSICAALFSRVPGLQIGSILLWIPALTVLILPLIHRRSYCDLEPRLPSLNSEIPRREGHSSA